MALLLDGSVSTLEDLASHDCAVLKVAHAEDIDLTRKLWLSREQVALELEALLSCSSSESGLTYGPEGIATESIVVTPALKLWHVFKTLELVYRDAYYSQLNDRYRGKRDEYRELARGAKDLLLDRGVGVALEPVPQAAQPKLKETSGLLPEGTYYVTVSWENTSRDEGASSVPTTIYLPAGGGIIVQPPGTPPCATGWNVYIGTAEDNMALQNRNRLQPGETWTQSIAPATQGRAPGNGQQLDYFRRVPRLLRRG